MPRVLTLTGEVKLPDDEFDAAEIVTSAKAGIAGAAKAMNDALGGDAVFAFDVKIGKPRRTRKVRVATERKPRERKPAAAPSGDQQPTS